MTIRLVGTFFIGRDRATGDRVFVTIDLRSVRRYETTTDHQPVEEYHRLSITGDVVRKGTRVIDWCGQCVEALDDVVTNPGGWSQRDVLSLSNIWKRWHFNDMRAGCDHHALDAQVGDPCPVTGYRYGHKWLVEVLPDDVLAEVHRLLALPTGAVPDYIIH